MSYLKKFWNLSSKFKKYSRLTETSNRLCVNQVCQSKGCTVLAKLWLQWRIHSYTLTEIWFTLMLTALQSYREGRKLPLKTMFLFFDCNKITYRERRISSWSTVKSWNNYRICFWRHNIRKIPNVERECVVKIWSLLSGIEPRRCNINFLAIKFLISPTRIPRMHFNHFSRE